MQERILQAAPPPDQVEQSLGPIGGEINDLSIQKSGLPWSREFCSGTDPRILESDPAVIGAIGLAERKMGLHDPLTSNIELTAVRQTVLTCLLLARQLSYPSEKIAQNFIPKSGETPGAILSRLIRWQKEMMRNVANK
jgi:hypothetical protein